MLFEHHHHHHHRHLSPTTATHVSPPTPTPASSSASLTPVSSVDRWVVHKFGGTSLASSECYRNALTIVLQARKQQQQQQASSSHPTLNTRLCVVVSAMGEVKPTSHVGRLMQQYHRHDPAYRVEKQEKVTNLLIKCTELAAHNDANYKAILAELKRRHMAVVDELISEQTVNQYQEMMDDELEAEQESDSKEGGDNGSRSPSTRSPSPSARAAYHYSHSDHGASTSSDLAMSILHMKETLRSLLEKDLDDLSFILRACWLSRTYDLEHNWSDSNSACGNTRTACLSDAAHSLLALLLRTCVCRRWFGYGELWSARLICTFINCVLMAMGHGPGRSNERAVWLDARDVLVLARTKEPMPDYAVSQEKLDAWLTSSIEVSTAKILVVTGYIASAANGMPTTLGRDGSDYSASIFAALLKAELAVIWTDVDGVYSANPTQVQDAVLLDELSYDEASELAYFGAKVLHPKTMTPVVALEIPIWIKNTFNYNTRGSCIGSTKLIAEMDRQRQMDGGARERRVGVAYGVKGFSEISNLCLIEVSGTGLIGVPGIASRLFQRLKDANVSVILVTQAGSELSMCLALPASQGELGLSVVRREFRDELLTKEIVKVEKSGPCACLAVVGDGMRHKRGVAGRVFASLADAGVNVQAIAQGSSERNISAIIAQSDVNRALLAVHTAFLTPEGAEGHYSPLLKSVSSRSELSTLAEDDSKEMAGKAASRLESFKLRDGGPEGGEGSRLLTELTDGQEAPLKRAYRLFTREVQVWVCLVVGGGVGGGWSEVDVEVLKKQLARAWGERKEVKVEVRTIVKIDAGTVTDVVKKTSTSLVWPELHKLLASWSSFSTSTHPVVIDCTHSELVLRQYRPWLAANIRLVTQRQVESPLSALQSLPLFSTLYDLQQRKERIMRVEAVLPCPLTFAFTVPTSSARLTPRAVRESHEMSQRMMTAIALAMGCDVKAYDMRCDYALACYSRQDEIERDIASYRRHATEQGMVYQYVASLTPKAEQPMFCNIDVGLRLCPPSHPFGWLKGYNASVMVYTEKRPADGIVLQGPVAWSEDGEEHTRREGEREKERQRQRQEMGISEEVLHALGQFSAIVSDLAK